jgi:GT2 family glycosyltransferase
VTAPPGPDAPAVSFVHGPDPVPLASRVLAAASSGSEVVVVGRPDAPDARLLDLVAGPYRIGAVIPGAEVDGLRWLGAADVAPGTAAEAVAVAARVAAAAPLDPRRDDPSYVVAVLAAAAGTAGLRVVADPAWPAPPAGAPGGARQAADGSAAGVRLLVVTAPLLSERFRADDRAVSQLIAALARFPGLGRVTVMTTERTPAPLRSRWTEAGLDVVEGPAAWAGETGDRYSHVIVTGPAARSSIRSWVDATQPQACRVLYFPSLPSRDARRVEPICHPEEMEGLELLRLDVEDETAHLVDWAHSVWCQWPGDAAVLGNWAHGVPIHELPPVLAQPAVHGGPGDRSGILLVAGEGADVIAGHEDAVLRALRSVRDLIDRPDRPADCTVVADRPTPLLVAACEEAGARIVGEAALEYESDRARVLLCAHGYGSGAPAVIMTAIERGLPVVCTEAALGDLDLGDLAGVAVCGNDVDLATRTRQLLDDAHRWDLQRAAAARLVRARYTAARHGAALASALASLGVDPGEGPAPFPAVRPATAALPAFHNPRLDTRPGNPPPGGRRPIDAPTAERERYQLWHELHGPGPAVLDGIRAELASVRARPLISILMPVYNTDVDVLAAAVDSVRAQIYDRWQLCIANDGSDREDTRAYLESLRGDERIVVVDRPAPSGISAATNAALAVATGDWVAFLDHDDELKPHALAQVVRWIDADPSIDVVYSDEDKLDPEGALYDPHIKPDWSPDQLTAQNYVCHLLVARRDLVEGVGGLRTEFDGSQDFDLILRLADRTDRIAHIPEPLYSWRAVPGSAAAEADAKPYAIEAARRAIADALGRRGYGGRVDTTRNIGFFRPRYPLPGEPKVSIIVPTRNGLPLLERCFGSILERSTYRNFEIVVVDNQSDDGGTLEFLAKGPWRVIRYPHPFNYARMMNLAARSVECDALLFLNNDTEIITPDWIEGLLEHAMRPEIGAVGGRLYYGNGDPQHEGILLGVGGWAHNTNHRGYWGRGELTRNVSAVTGACTMMRPSVYWRIGGNDERLRIAYNDVDLCLRVHQAGYQVVYTPHVELYHHESATRGGVEHEDDGPLYGIRWRVKDNVDPYYSPMFEDFPPFLIRL